MNVSDRQFGRRSAAGDLSAFTALVERYRAPLIGYLLGFGVGRGDAEELAQEAFLRAWQNLPGIDAAKIVGWIYRTAHNLAVSLARRPRIAVLDSDPQAAAERDDPSADVHRAVAQLPDDFRIAVSLRHFSGLSHDEIAAALEIPTGTVRSRISRAYERLRPLLAHLLEEHR